MEFVFQDIYWESGFFQGCQDFVDMFDMFFFVFGIDEDIIQICCGEVVEEFVEDVVNEVLEDVRGIVETKWHYQSLVESESGDEGCFPFVSFGYPDSVENDDDIQFGENLGFIQSIQGFPNQGQEVLVFDGDIVQASIIGTDSDTTIWFPYEEER